MSAKNTQNTAEIALQLADDAAPDLLPIADWLNLDPDESGGAVARSNGRGWTAPAWVWDDRPPMPCCGLC